jgi:hypothetical protein
MLQRVAVVGVGAVGQAHGKRADPIVHEREPFNAETRLAGSPRTRRRCGTQRAT